MTPQQISESLMAHVATPEFAVAAALAGGVLFLACIFGMLALTVVQYHRLMRDREK